MLEEVLSYSQIGMDYETYLNHFAKQVNELDIQNGLNSDKIEFSKLNLQRTLRLEKYFIPSQELIDVINSIKFKQTWLIITELWCGDSAQSISIFGKAALLNNNINLRIVFRDENPEIMEKYTTNGKRSVPKFIAFNENDNELFQWGPRPAEAQKLFERLKNEGLDKPEINKQLHLWYGRNRGKDVEKELIELLKKHMEI